MYKLVAIGGTFDRLHKGHRRIVREAFRLGGRVLIALTSDKYIQEKFKVNFKIQKFEERKVELERFLRKKGLLERAEIVKIDDVYGGADKRIDIEAILVTEETERGARLINKKRVDRRLSKLVVIKLSLILAEDCKPISSQRIRMGEMDREGRVYKKFKVQSSKFKNDERLRRELKKPLGILIKGNPKSLTQLAPKLQSLIVRLQPTVIITVGDEVTKMCNQVDISVNLAIIDYHVGRRKVYNSLSDLGFAAVFAGGAFVNDFIVVSNPAGNITRDLYRCIDSSIKRILVDGKVKIILVKGEEDLAGLPAVLLAPLGSVVLYGQPGEGIVVIEVTEQMKQKVVNLIGRK